MVTGHLREQNGYFQMILTWKDASGKRRSKSISTGLTVKGNKKRAEKMLMKAPQKILCKRFSTKARISHVCCA